MANGGLIPIVTKNADVDLNGYGFTIDDFSVASVLKSIKQSEALTINELKEQSAKILDQTKQFNSFDYFKTDFKQKLQEAIKVI